VGVELSMPLGFRQAKAQQRNVELRLAKARQALAAQELEINHELSVAFQRLDRYEAVIKTNQEIVDAANERVRAVEADYHAGRTTLDMLLQAHIARTNAEVEYHKSVTAYNQSLVDFDYRRGQIFTRNRVELAEGEAGEMKEANAETIPDTAPTTSVAKATSSASKRREMNSP
jgi:outer membrane protein TolC